MKRKDKLQQKYINEIIGYGVEAFDPVEEAEELAEFLEELEDTEQIDMLNALFKCGIELYTAGEDGHYGEVHFVGKDNKIYDSDLEVVSAKEFRKQYGCKVSDVKRAVKNGDCVSPSFEYYGDTVEWVIFREMDCYAI